MDHPEQIATRAALYRGGTSKAFVVRQEDLPSTDREQIAQWLTSVYGAPNVRRIDGVAGSDPLTNKFAIVGPPTRPDADVDYTFAQVGYPHATVDWNLLCGNISSAIGPFAIDEGMVEAEEPSTVVRIHNTNTGKIINAEVQVIGGRAKVSGTEAIAGVPGTGAPIRLDFSDSAGAQGSGLLPTGHARDEIEVRGIGTVEFSLVDAAMPCLFLPAARFGLTGAEDPAVIEADKDLLACVDSVRNAVAVMIGWADSSQDAIARVPYTPAAVIVGPPQDWTEYGTGTPRPASDSDFSIRSLGRDSVHRAFMATGTVATGVAAALPGTIVHQVCRDAAHAEGTYRIAHPSGTISASVSLDATADGDVRLHRAALVRTARRLLDGTIYANRDQLPWT